MMAELQQQREGELGHRGGTVGGHVGHGDSQFPGRLDIHHVVSRRQHANVTKPLVMEPAQHPGVQGGLVGQYELSAPCALKRELGFGSIVNLGGSQLLQTLPGKISRIQGVSVKHDDSHSFLPSLVKTRTAPHKPPD